MKPDKNLMRLFTAFEKETGLKPFMIVPVEGAKKTKKIYLARFTHWLIDKVLHNGRELLEIRKILNVK